MKPYVGKPVHFVDMAGEHLAGLVVCVWDGEVINAAVYDSGKSFPTETPVLTHQLVPHNEATKRPGSWHFIEEEQVEPADEHSQTPA